MGMYDDGTWKSTYRILGENAGPDWALDCAEWAHGGTVGATRFPYYTGNPARSIFNFNKIVFEQQLIARMAPTQDQLVGATQFAEAWKAAMLASVSVDIRVGDSVIDNINEPVWTWPVIDELEFCYIHEATIWRSPWNFTPGDETLPRPENGYEKLLELQYSPMAYTYEDAWLPIKLAEAFRRLRFTIKGHTASGSYTQGGDFYYYLLPFD